MKIFVDEVLADFGDWAQYIVVIGTCEVSGISEKDFTRFVEDAFFRHEKNAEKDGEGDYDKSDNNGDELGFEAGSLGSGCRFGGSVAVFRRCRFDVGRLK